MNIKEFVNEPLANHTTFRIGGPAERLVIPQDKESLIEVIISCKERNIPFFILGRGSNVLICNEGLQGVVIKNTHACTELQIAGNYVNVGSSVSLQKLITFCIDNNLYGMEYLYSVPGNVGGAIYMNAGRGEKFKQSISNHIVSVEIFDGEKIRVLKQNECYFEYRSSIFQKEKSWIILSALLDLPKQNKKIGKQKIKERIQFVKKVQDLKYANAGTVFKRNFNALSEIIGYRIGDAKFSTKAPGWIINLGKATFNDVYMLIIYAMDCHKHRGLPIPELELVIFQ